MKLRRNLEVEILRRVKFYLGTGFTGCNHEEVYRYEDDVPDEVIDEDFEDWKNGKLDAQWWEMEGEE